MWSEDEWDVVVKCSTCHFKHDLICQGLGLRGAQNVFFASIASRFLVTFLFIK